MTDEEFQRKMDFIVDHQAQFASDIQQLREVQAQFASDIQQLWGGMHQLVEAQAQTNQIVVRLANVTAVGFKDVTAKIDALVDSQIRLSDAQSRTDGTLKDANAKIDALVDSQIRLTDAQSRLTDAQSRLSDAQSRLSDAQSRTDENLRNLIAVVDRYFREGRNGESGR